MNLKKVGFAILAFTATFSTNAWSQKEVLFDQYIENPMAINPGYTGVREDFNMNIMMRRRWLSIPNAPVTQTLAMDGAILNKKLGLGFIALNDRMSPFTTTGFYGSASYIHRTASGWKLSIGGQTGINVLPYYSHNASGRKVLGSMGVGFWAQNQTFHFGVSQPELLTLDYGNLSSQWNYNTPIYGTAGAKVELNPDFTAVPNLTLILNDQIENEIHIGSKFWYHQQFALGAFYRSGYTNRIHITADVQVGDKVRLGYSYSSRAVETRYSVIGTGPQGMHQIIFKFTPNPTRFSYQ